MLPCLIFEDEHLLVVNKPAGMNTHAPSPFAGEGIYDWVRHREPRWAKLAIVHRLDKETSGVLVFGKTTLANRSLTEQFTERAVGKKYQLLTDRPVKSAPLTVVSSLIRAGEKYLSRPAAAGGARAETRFRVLDPAAGRILIEAEPLTGRTHQIRVHAAEQGFPILGDTLYGGAPWPRVCLHAAELTLKHPTTGGKLTFRAANEFEADTRLALRAALIAPQETNAYRLVQGAADGWPGWYVDLLDGFLLSQGEQPLTAAQRRELSRWMEHFHARGAYHKLLIPARRIAPSQASPQPLLGEAVLDAFAINENGLRFETSSGEGYSVGLFLDQRDNRRRILVNQVAAEFPLFADGPAGAEVLNTFAYTCGFSVCAAKAGARVTSLDLSKKYLEWGRRNFLLNRIDPAGHEFIYGDAFDWLRRLAKKGRRFDAVILDPPTFSQSREHGAFQAEKDYGELVRAALPVLKPDGILFAATNAARLKPEAFLEMLAAAVKSLRRKISRQHYFPQPPDFPITRAEPAYLKTVWLKIA
ncbi:MAG TPA: pseudouridine synthase [Verrucomicrobiae bacterium]|nr:pseudouridine synthase [Verrucomicrobiae bacterium]